MAASVLLALREGLEISLVIGIVLGVLDQLKRQDLKRVVWWGILSASLVSVFIATLLNSIEAEFEGTTETLFEGVVLLLAAGLLTWMIFWMFNQARSLRTEIETDVKKAISGTSRWSLYLLAFLTVIREGFELTFFLLAARLASTPVQIYVGALLGLGISVSIGWIMFGSSRKLNLRRFFQVTNILLLMFAAGLVVHSIHEFIILGWIPPLVNPIWDINHFLPEKSFVGQLLGAIFGYEASPSLVEVFAYCGYILLLFMGLRFLPQMSKNIKISSGHTIVT